MKVPKHIAIIMDGNGRWAQKRFLPKIAGHTKGVMAVERSIKACTDLGVKVLTLYTFSTENWKRSKKEVNALMGLLQIYLNRKAEELKNEALKAFDEKIGFLSHEPGRAKLKAAIDFILTRKK